MDGDTDGERASTGGDGRKGDGSGSGGGQLEAPWEARLLRQTAATVQRLDSRVTALEDGFAELSHSRTASGGNDSALGSRLERLHYAGANAARSQTPAIETAVAMESRARDFLMQSLDRYGVGSSSGGGAGHETRLSSRGDFEASATGSVGPLHMSRGRDHLESFRSKRED